MIVKDHWRITTAAIQLEMERISGLLEKSVHFQSRTSTPHPLRERHEAACSLAQPAVADSTPEVSAEIPACL